MRLPRDLSGAELVRALSVVGYVVTRQTGGHIKIDRDCANTPIDELRGHRLRARSLSKGIFQVRGPGRNRQTAYRNGHSCPRNSTDRTERKTVFDSGI